MPESENHKWMTLALEQAKLAAQAADVPVGAVLVKDGQCIARGFNRREQDQDPCGHAEVIAIREASRSLGSWRLEGCRLFVTLEPCPMCLAACQQARVAEVIYGAKDPKGGALSLGYALHEDPKTNHRFIVTPSLDPRCELILKEFFKSLRS